MYALDDERIQGVAALASGLHWIECFVLHAVVAAGTGGRGYASRAAASVQGLTLPHTAGALLAAGVIAGQ